MSNSGYVLKNAVILSAIMAGIGYGVMEISALVGLGNPLNTLIIVYSVCIGYQFILHHG